MTHLQVHSFPWKGNVPSMYCAKATYISSTSNPGLRQSKMYRSNVTSHPQKSISIIIYTLYIRLLHDKRKGSTIYCIKVVFNFTFTTSIAPKIALFSVDTSDPDTYPLPTIVFECSGCATDPSRCMDASSARLENSKTTSSKNYHGRAFINKRPWVVKLVHETATTLRVNSNRVQIFPLREKDLHHLGL